VIPVSTKHENTFFAKKEEASIAYHRQEQH